MFIDWDVYKGAEMEKTRTESPYANLSYFYKDLRLPKDEIPSNSQELCISMVQLLRTKIGDTQMITFWRADCGVQFIFVI
jgi:hypothetical protein